ncbi:helix-turn-helix domain-containing protein [Priestia megaterium]|uniref:helix-turn-helix domain-containing protein n=1 Tax=Priestia megaterium TaxID=1404 RepID=UPI002E1A66E5|nr:helix-turn-helix domain-containing protein [Priestia megaterium]
MTKANAVLSVDFRKEYSTAEDGVTNYSRVCLSLDAIHSGLIKQVGANRLAILLAIVSHMNEEGQCFPSQAKIAELTGQGRATVQRNLQELCEVEFNGQKLLHKELVGGKRKKTVYTITAGAITSADLVDETAEAEKTTELVNGKDFVLYFGNKFKEVFGEGHTTNFAKEGAVFKALLKTYEPDSLKDIIDVVFRDYKKKWYKPQFPHPTVYQLRSWLADEAFKIVKAEKEQAQQLEVRKQKAVEQDDTDKALELFDI